MGGHRRPIGCSSSSVWDRDVSFDGLCCKTSVRATRLWGAGAAQQKLSCTTQLVVVQVPPRVVPMGLVSVIEGTSFCPRCDPFGVLMFVVLAFFCAAMAGL